MADEKSPTQSTVKLGLWLTFIAFLLILLVFRGKISEIQFGEKGVSAKMMSGGQEVSTLSPQDKQSAQQALEQRINQLEVQVKSHPQNASEGNSEGQAQFSNAVNQAPQPAVLVNLAGYWNSADGSAFAFTQNGSYVGFQGYNSGVLYVIGYGQIMGSSCTFQTYNLMGRAGTLVLQIAEDMRHLSGQYTDGVTGQVFPIQIYR